MTTNFMLRCSLGHDTIAIVGPEYRTMILVIIEVPTVSDHIHGQLQEQRGILPSGSQEHSQVAYGGLGVQASLHSDMANPTAAQRKRMSQPWQNRKSAEPTGVQSYKP